MSRKWFSILALIATATLFLSVSSCSYNQHLVSIQVQPTAGASFGGVDPSLIVDLKAFGTYIHPPQTKDITTLVTWQSDTPQVAQVTAAGAVSPNTNCGNANVFATLSDGGNVIVSNSAHVVVDGPISLGCPQGGASSNLAVVISAGIGTITSAPAGINCGPSCAAQFPTGTTVSLTATPTSPSTSVSWANCDTSSGTACTVFLQSDRTVTATFR
jgi:hypothetical protein